MQLFACREHRRTVTGGYHASVLALLNPDHYVSAYGYAAIFVLAVLQSCCVPTSSELTMGFAGFLAYKGQLSLAGAIAIGAGGEVVGAYIAWVIGRTLGRGFVDRFGKYLLLTHHDLDRAEAWYDRHDRWGVFGSRLLPVVRNFVALPAGVAEVPLVRFGLLTAAGSLVWDGAMAGIGYGLANEWTSIMHGFNDAGYVLGALVVLAIAVVIWHRWRSYRAVTRGAGVVTTPVHRRSSSSPASSASASASPASASSTPAASQPADPA